MIVDPGICSSVFNQYIGVRKEKVVRPGAESNPDLIPLLGGVENIGR